MEKYKLEVGQKYRVIKETLDNFNQGTIVTVAEILSDTEFNDLDGYYFDLEDDELQLIKSKTKKVKKYRYSRKEWFKKYGMFINGYNVSKLQSEAYFDLLATQPQPIKEENKKYKGLMGTDCIYGNPDCPICGKQEDNKECKHEWNKYGSQCVKCGKLNIINCSTPSQQEESKDIELPKTLFLQYTDEWCVPRFRMTDEFKNWMKQVTDTLNSLTKRNKI